MARRGWGMRELWATGLAWLAGLALLHRCERLPSGPEYAVLGAAFLLLVLLLLLVHRRHVIVLAACVAVLAFTQAALRAELRLRAELHPAWEGRDLVLVGRVDALPIAITARAACRAGASSSRSRLSARPAWPCRPRCRGA